LVPFIILAAVPVAPLAAIAELQAEVAALKALVDQGQARLGQDDQGQADADRKKTIDELEKKIKVLKSEVARVEKVVGEGKEVVKVLKPLVPEANAAADRCVTERIKTERAAELAITVQKNLAQSTTAISEYRKLADGPDKVSDRKLSVSV
jgi:hypothetical protein